MDFWPIEYSHIPVKESNISKKPILELYRAWTVVLLDYWSDGLLNILRFQKKNLELFRAWTVGLLDYWTMGLLNIQIFQKTTILELYRAWTVGLLDY